MNTTGQTDLGSTMIQWALPVWTETEAKWCKVGLHILTRKRVVWGYVGYFTSVEQWYCACGRKCWIKYEGHWADTNTTEPGAHLNWITGHVEMQDKMEKHRRWERLMSEAHPCWGEPYKCISCGCSVDGPCISHKAGRAPNPVNPGARERLAAARAELWPQ